MFHRKKATDVDNSLCSRIFEVERIIYSLLATSEDHTSLSGLTCCWIMSNMVTVYGSTSHPVLVFGLHRPFQIPRLMKKEHILAMC